MRKLLILLLFAMTLPFISVLGATETITYDLTFLDNTYWNLDTGAISTNNNWASTSRLPIYENVIDLSDAQVHHVLFWSAQNVYLGYFNIESTYIGSKHLGNSGYQVTIPIGAGRFALMVNKTGVDTVVPELPTYTYDDIFSSPSYLGYTDDTLNDTLGNVFANPTYLTTNIDFFGSTLTLSDIINNGLLNAPQLVANGDFSNGTTGWNSSLLQTFNVSNGIATILANSVNDVLFRNTELTNAVKYYFAGRVKSTSNQVRIDISSAFAANHSGSNQYELLSIVSNWPGSTGSWIIGVKDLRNSGYDEIFIDYVFLFNISTLISNKARNDAGTLFSSLTDSNIKTVMDGWQSNGYLFNDKLFQIWYLKNTLVETISNESDWVYVGPSDGNTGIFKYNVDYTTKYDDFIDDLPSPYTKLDPENFFTSALNNATTFYEGYYYVQIPNVYTVNDLYVYFATTALENVRFEHITPLTDNEALYYWNLYKDAINQVERYEWYTFGGVTSSNYVYYSSLFADAVLETERYEWYTDFGITSTNYATIRSQYDYLLNYGTGISFASFQDLEVTYDREEVIPPVQKTFLESIEDYLDNLGFGTFGYILISLVIMIVIAIGLGLLKATFWVIMLVEGILFVMFSIFGWFPLWIVIVVIIALFVLIITKLGFGGGGDEV